MQPMLEVREGQVWRGRLVLDGPGQYVKADFVANTIKTAGAAQVWVWKSPDAASFPADWDDVPPPPNPARSEDISDLFEVQWLVQLRVGPNPMGGLVEAFKIPTSGPNWRIHDAWIYLESAAPPVDPEDPDPEDPDPEDPDPEDPEEEDDIGDYAGRPAGDLDLWAPNVLRAAWRMVMGVYPTPVELQTVQAVGRVEGYYGWAGKPKNWAGNHNWGAITCAKSKAPARNDDIYGEDEDEVAVQSCSCGFPAWDGFWVDGQYQPYQTCFASRPTNLEGAMHLVEVLVLKRQPVQDALANQPGELVAFTRAMRDTIYFCRNTGRGRGGRPSCQAATEEQKREDALYYAKVLDGACKAIGGRTGEGQLAFLNPPDTPSEERVPPESIPDTPRATRTTAGMVAVGVMGVVGAITTTAMVVMRRRKK